MKLLAIDVGNTRVKVGFFEGTELQEVQGFEHLEEVTQALKTEHNTPLIVSSVAQPLSEMQKILKDFQKVMYLEPHTPLPLQNAYATPHTLGYDRLAAMVGANGRFPHQNCLVVDMGTAIKYDLVTEDNAFVGGIISPGRAMRFKALHTFTQKLPLIDTTAIPPLVGSDTQGCLASGVMNGIVAEVNGILEKYFETYKPVVLLCGGDAPYFETQINYPTFAAPNLVLEGLIRILLYNVAKV